MRRITKNQYAKLKKCDFYKKYLGWNLHLCTIYGVPGNKEYPLWKRILSHVYVLTTFQVVDDKICPHYLSDNERQQLINRITDMNET